MSDNTSVSIATKGLSLRPGDPLPQVCGMHGSAIITRYDGVTITYRHRRWYDGPRLWFRAFWRRIVP